VSDEMRESLVRFLDAVDAIAIDHDEVSDSGVRQTLAYYIDERLVKGHAVDLSGELHMFSDEGNELVRIALTNYLDEATRRADVLILDREARQSAVWDRDAVSGSGEPVEHYLGWRE
jgi:hypothetical protein